MSELGGILIFQSGNTVNICRMIHSLTKVKILKNRGRFGKFLWCYGPRLCFFCAAEKPEKPRKMYSTKLFTFSEVSLAFPRHRKNKVEARKIHKNLTKICQDFEKIFTWVGDSIFLPNINFLYSIRYFPKSCNLQF